MREEGAADQLISVRGVVLLVLVIGVAGDCICIPDLALTPIRHSDNQVKGVLSLVPLSLVPSVLQSGERVDKTKNSRSRNCSFLSFGTRDWPGVN